MTGDDTPAPVSGVRQATPAAALHVTGSPVSVLTPLPLGPRQCGQSSAANTAPSAPHQTVIPAMIVRRMLKPQQIGIL
jgi:hypothetical protein